MKKTILTLFTLGFLGASSTYAQVGIGTQTPDPSAILELESTEKGFLPPRLTTSQRDLILLPAEGLVIYNTDNQCLELFNGNNDWISICDGSVVTSPPSTVIGANGVEWMDRNLGASRVATSSTDAQAYGNLYQWGRASDGHQVRSLTCPSGCYDVELTNSDGVANFDNDISNAWYGKFILRNSGLNNWVAPNTTNGTITVDDLWQGVNGMNNPCPNGYRIPTIAELDNEVQSWTSYNRAGAFASPLKLPAAGYRNRSNGELTDVGSLGMYWTSTTSNWDVRRLRFDSITANFNFNVIRSIGFSVRCIKD
jgi:uncharacterized protein (TIGR02145 family)